MGSRRWSAVQHSSTTWSPSRSTMREPSESDTSTKRWSGFSCPSTTRSPHWIFLLESSNFTRIWVLVMALFLLRQHYLVVLRSFDGTWEVATVVCRQCPGNWKSILNGPLLRLVCSLVHESFLDWGENVDLFTVFSRAPAWMVHAWPRMGAGMIVHMLAWEGLMVMLSRVSLL